MISTSENSDELDSFSRTLLPRVVFSFFYVRAKRNKCLEDPLSSSTLLLPFLFGFRRAILLSPQQTINVGFNAPWWAFRQRRNTPTHVRSGLTKMIWKSRQWESRLLENLPTETNDPSLKLTLPTTACTRYNARNSFQRWETIFSIVKSTLQRFVPILLLFEKKLSDPRDKIILTPIQESIL